MTLPMIGGGQYTAALPPGLSSSLNAIAAAYLMMANINLLISGSESRSQMKATSSAATNQEHEADRGAMGEFVLGGAEIAAGVVSIGATGHAISGLSDGEALDGQLANAQDHQKALSNRSGEGMDASIADKPVEAPTGEQALEQYIKKGNITGQAPDKDFINGLSDDDATQLSKQVNQTLEDLTSKKSEHSTSQKKRKGHAKQAQAASTMTRGAGQMVQALYRGFAGQAAAAKTIYDGLAQVFNQLQNVSIGQYQSYMGEAFKPFEQMAQMAQTQTPR